MNFPNPMEYLKKLEVNKKLAQEQENLAKQRLKTNFRTNIIDALNAGYTFCTVPFSLYTNEILEELSNEMDAPGKYKYRFEKANYAVGQTLSSIGSTGVFISVVEKNEP